MINGNGGAAGGAGAGGALYRAIFAAATRTDAERAHGLGMAAIRLAVRMPGGERLLRRVCVVDDPALRVWALGCEFPSPLGVAAGLDKDGRAVEGLAALGFGFIEVGTVTAVPQPGNPRPRVHRLVGDQAIVNRMGFNNDGAAAVADRLRSLRDQQAVPVIGVNIGKSRVVPGEHAVVDYVASAKRLAPYADYLVVNVSSPNTPGLRALQAAGSLRPLLTAVRDAADGAAGRHVPLLVKISPDLTDPAIVTVADLALELGLAGIVAVNTTTSRPDLRSTPAEVVAAGDGGLSGPPLCRRSVRVLELLRDRVGDRLTLVSVGGIVTAEDAWQRICAGATLVQAYTAFVYGGPSWPFRVSTGLAELVRARGRGLAHAG